MGNNNSIMKLIREEVWPLHEKIEKESPLTPVAEGVASKEQYAQVLKLLYGIIVPFEDNLKRRISLSLCGFSVLGLLESNSWARCHLLEQDLVALGVNKSEIASLPICTKIPQCTTSEEALAILYLLQGSRLGGKVIAVNAKKSLSFDQNTGCAYFSSNNSEVGHYWMAFKDFTEANLNNKSSLLVIKHIKNYFTILDDWLKGAN